MAPHHSDVIFVVAQSVAAARVDVATLPKLLRPQLM
jgi:hypothetical protein